MFSYHTFKDLGIEGIYDHEPLLPKYHFPPDDFWKGKDVLDVGCASGFFSKYFAERGANVTAVDINVSPIAEIRERASLKTLTIVGMDLYDMKYDSCYDFVLCGSLLMHVFYPMLLLKMIHKALRPGGTFVLCTGGVNSSEPTIRVEKYLGRGKGEMESEIRSANESLWWLSPSAGINMLHTLGFQDIQHLDSFMLTSTPHGVKVGHNYSALHHVWKAKKI